ncbi:hypothetical protein UCRNP2_9655 [Neofusicoccum parvum UCRNP2]|uniref:Uncharacterized protein n=1 Tax=Botryosphaeria parva (strain UCR-NP2) TaxID=1287680 RepID=R1GCN3_BOTPV|nr:hypothetical protein UCRNP2_9655 [Neofusicoccum parvum UCRNP2]
MDEPVSPRTGPTQTIPQCCCGRTDCAFLSHNGELLESLERDVQTAAQLGQAVIMLASLTFCLQALLQRHEAYIADSEAERRRMAAKIETLEHEKADLEARNARTVQENRALLDQLEALNNAASETDSHCHELTAALMETQEELQRMTNLAARAESLERQLAELEKEQMELTNKLHTTAGEEKSAIKRWRKAEQTIAVLTEQVERIEKEAKEERERHVEVVSRMERRRAVERELETAAGRLKGAAAAKAGHHDKTGTNVVSHFVKDILQDNANLQLGIVELRDMLMNSNDEVERLREQLLLHQPMSEASEEPSGPTFKIHKAAPTIEINANPSLRISEEELDNLSPIYQDVITEEQETSSNADVSGTNTPTPEAQDSEFSDDMYTNGQVGHGLRRATSHESLLSVPQRSKSFKLRNPGVNQAGPILGFAKGAKAPCKVVVKQDELDVDALRESLAEAGDSPVRTEPQIRIEPPPETTAAGA